MSVFPVTCHIRHQWHPDKTVNDGIWEGVRHLAEDVFDRCESGRRGQPISFDQEQLPGNTHTGWFAFDVPESVTMPKTLNVQSDPDTAKTNPPTLVRFG